MGFEGCSGMLLRGETIFIVKYRVWYNFSRKKDPLCRMYVFVHQHSEGCSRIGPEFLLLDISGEGGRLGWGMYVKTLALYLLYLTF